MFVKGFTDNLNLFFVVVFGIIGIFSPMFSIFVANFGGRAEIGLSNSATLLLLAVLIIVFLVIKAFSLFFSNHKKLFLLDLMFLLLTLVSFIVHLSVFLSL